MKPGSIANIIKLLEEHRPFVGYQTEWACIACELDYSDAKPGAKYGSQVYQQHLIALIKGEK